MSNSQTGSSLKSVSLVSVCSFGQLVLQFLLQILLASYFGAQAETDAYFAALTLPLAVSTVLVGSLGYAFIPIYIETRDADGEDVAAKFCGQAGSLLGIVSITVATCVFFSSGSLVARLHPGFDSDQLLRTEQLFRILVWTIPLSSGTFLLRAVYHASNRFRVPSFAPVLGLSSTLAIVVAMHEQWGVSSVAIGTVLGQAIGLGLHLPWCRVPFHRFMLFGQLSNSTKRCLGLMAPLIFGAAYYNLDPIVDRYLTSSMSDGRISQMSFAWRIASSLITVSASALSLVAFPKFSELASSGDRTSLAREISAAFRLLIFLTIPMCACIYFYGETIIRDFFERGRFSSGDTTQVAILLSIYLMVVVGNGVGEITSKVLYAMKRMKQVVLIGISGFSVGVFLKFQSVDEYGVDGIAAASGVVALLNALWMLLLVGKHNGRGSFDGVTTAVINATAGTIAALLAASVVPTSQRFTVVIALALGGIAYLLTTARLGDSNGQLLLQWFLSRLPRTGNSVEDAE